MLYKTLAYSIMNPRLISSTLENLNSGIKKLTRAHGLNLFLVESDFVVYKDYINFFN